MARYMKIALFPALVIVIFVYFFALLLTGCGGEEASGAGCVGTVIKTYTEYHADLGYNSGSINIPNGSTKYYIAVRRSDGTACSKKLGKSEWLGIAEGDTYG